MNILLVEDDTASRQYLSSFLRDVGYKVFECNDGLSALNCLEEKNIQIIISDIKMPGISGIELLKTVRQKKGRTQLCFILVTAYGDLDTAVEALRFGANDYLLKPLSIETLMAKINHYTSVYEGSDRNNMPAIDNRQEKEVSRETARSFTQNNLQYDSAEPDSSDALVSPGGAEFYIYSPAMKKVITLAEKLFAHPAIPVIIEGETGTGKELVAKYIHYGCGKAKEVGPFIAVNCAAIPPSVFESEIFGYEEGSFTGGLPKGKKGKLDLAEGGTLFLDEIAELPLELQSKLLRLIQEKEYYRVGGLKRITTNVRFICATNKDLVEEVKKGRFRSDLFYRLSVGRIKVPPLRERKEDILPLAQHFLQNFALEKKKRFKKIGKAAADLLVNHPWPGNVRELKNCMEWITLMYDDEVLKPAHVTSYLESVMIEEIEEEEGYGSNKNKTYVNEIKELNLPANCFPIEDFTKEILKRVLKMHCGNKSAAAKYLGISRQALYSKLKKYKIEDLLE